MPMNNSEPDIYPRDQHTISRSQIDPDALKIMYRLLNSGYKAYLVGGGVRDLLLGKQPKDFDIATDATPRRIKSLFRNSRIIGRRFKLAHVFFGNGKIIEVSTFRDFSDPLETAEEESAEDAEGASESETPRFIGDNKYGTEATDALRRDLTINGLFYDISSFSIIDYVGGMQDLQDRIIRVIGQPDQRFQEDPVRMLRVVRHAVKARFNVDPECVAAISRNRHLIQDSPPMRIFEELKKDMCSGYFLPILRMLTKTELVEYILPELLSHYASVFEDRSHFSHLLRKVDELSFQGKAPASATTLALLCLGSFLDGSRATMPAIGSSSSFGAESSFRSFQDEAEELVRFVRSRFSRLAVPRRDREKIESILVYWHYSATQPIEKVKTSRLFRKDCLAELVSFLEIAEVDEAVIRVIRNTSPRSRGGAEPAEFHNRPSRRRRRRRPGDSASKGSLRSRHSDLSEDGIES